MKQNSTPKISPSSKLRWNWDIIGLYLAAVVGVGAILFQVVRFYCGY